MGIVTIRCPETGEQVPTGVVMDHEVFEAAKPTVRAFVCDACGETHVWEKPDATVSPEELR